MPPNTVLQRQPAEAIRWLRAQVGLGSATFAACVEREEGSMARCERGQRVGLASPRRIVPLLARHPNPMAAVGVAFVASFRERSGQGGDMPPEGHAR